MKKLILFIAGLLIGFLVTGSAIFIVTEHRANEMIRRYQEDENVTFVDSDDISTDHVNIAENYTLERFKEEHPDFSLPSEDILSRSRIYTYDVSDNGKAVLVCCSLSAKMGAYADIFTTVNFGRTWEKVQDSMYITSECISVIYMGDTINLIDSSYAAGYTVFYISNDNGRNFTSEAFVYQFGTEFEPVCVYPEILSKDSSNNTVTILWRDTDEEKAVLVCEHSAVTYAVTMEFYANADNL